MKKLAIAIGILGVFALGGVLGYFYLVESIKSSSLQDMTRAEYLAQAVPTCMDGGMTKAECECSYNAWIDAYGVKGTFEIDKQTALNKEYVVPDSAIEKITKCFTPGK